MSSLISEIQRSLQYAVSGDKYRYRENHWDLDLTYITSRIIAMGIPGDGVSSNWRNNIKDVSAFLHSKHQGHFKIINVSGESYNYQMFDHHVEEFPFPDHHPPPLDVYLAILKAMHAWLVTDPANIIVVHCLAGRSRTGTIVSGYLLYSSFCENALQAISYFNNKRSLEAKDVCLPSQIRYVGYMDSLLHDHERTALNHPTTRILRAVIITPPFRLEGSVSKGKAFWKPHLRLQHQSLPQDTFFRKTYTSFSMDENSVRLDVPKVPIQGDTVLKLSHVCNNPITYGRVCMKVQKVVEAATSLDSDLIVDVARISFHTSFLEGLCPQFESFEIDAHKAGPISLDSKYIPSNITITLELEPLSDTTHIKSEKSEKLEEKKSASYVPTNNLIVPTSSVSKPNNNSSSNSRSTAASPREPSHEKDNAATRIQVLPSKEGRWDGRGGSTTTPTPSISTSSQVNGNTIQQLPSPNNHGRTRTKSDPPYAGGAGGGVKLSSGFVVYPHDALLPSSLLPPSSPSSSSQAFPLDHSPPTTRGSTSSSSPSNNSRSAHLMKSNPEVGGGASSSSSSSSIVDGGIAGFHGVKVHEDHLDAITEFKREQAARKQAALAAHVAGSPVKNVYMPNSPVVSSQPVIMVHSVSHSSQSHIHGSSQTPATGYYPVYNAPITSKEIPPTGFPPGYVLNAQPTTRRRPVSVHYGALPVLVGNAPPLAPKSPTPSYVPPYSTPPTNSYENPYAPPGNPYPVAGVDSNPYHTPKSHQAIVPEGWPPGYIPPSTSASVSIPSSSNPYAPSASSSNAFNPYANPYANMMPPPQ
jgi:phosphatidylinositol-3,4,5-trisphosphate 3-phosphatase/dual-specificity protein phosphatase PTEN